MADIKNILQENAEKAKQIFDLCDKVGEGVYDKVHIIDNSITREQKQEYRIYHSGGYCMDVTREEVGVSEDEINYSAIDGFEYSFESGNFEGFRDINEDGAIYLLRGLK